MRIIFSGGGTLGPVTPLLTIHEILKKEYPDATFLWVGTKRGPERKIVEEAGIEFITLASGKFRRYISIWNILDIIRVIIGVLQSLKIIWTYNPTMCISAGAFVSVPLHWVAWLHGTKTWIHQQDARIGLANKLMAPFAKVITTALKDNVSHFSKRKTRWLGNPVRKEVMSGKKGSAQTFFKLQKKLPVVFATGGGTGSLKVNQLIVEAVQHLKGFAQVIHLSGKERPQELVERAVKHFDYYQVHKFFTHEMAEAYAAADIVVSRGGFGTLTEIAALKKPAIIIPKPGHQEENVKLLAARNAVHVLHENTCDGNMLAKEIRELLEDGERMGELSANIAKELPLAQKEEILSIIKTLI